MCTPQAVAMIKAANNAALTDMGNQALQDVSKHVPHDQGVLEGSGLSNSDTKAVNGKYIMRWSTPYAQYLWHGDVMYGNPTGRTYGPKRISFTSINSNMRCIEIYSVVGIFIRILINSNMRCCK